MSGHNPHGRSLGQPNSSWNHLQVPSYIPRQPQLAHMSNERQIVRSPPTWHTPTPSDSLFSFMAAANHKVPLESGIIKPLIPPFVAPNMPPFGSVDLSISAARNSLTPSPRSLHSPGITPNMSSPPPVEFSSIIKNNPNSGQNRNLSPTPGVIQTAASVKEKQHQTSISPSLLINNGDLNAPGLFIRDAKQINSELVKITREPIGLQPMSEPVELVKEAIFHSMANHSIPMSPTRTDNRLVGPIPPAAVSSPASPEDIQTQHHVNQESSMNVIQTVNAQSPSYNCNSPTILPPATVPSNSISASASIIQPPISPPSNNVSEDSIDSNGSKKRRKRKPNKTIRMSSDSNDNNSNLENNSIIISQPNTLLDDRIVTTNETSNTDHPPIIVSPQLVDDKRTDISPVEPPMDKLLAQSQLNTSVDPALSSLSMLSSSGSSNEKVLLNSNNDNSSSNNNDNSKTDADECETIDKIAEMIAKTDKNKEILLSLSTANKHTSQTDDTDLEKTLNGTISCDTSNILTENTNSFEDVENKLEEMFAGIVDDRPSQPSTPQQMTPQTMPPSNVASTISSVIQTRPVTIANNLDTVKDSIKECDGGEALNSSGVNDNLKMLGLNNTTDDDDKHENSGDNNNIIRNEVKLTDNDTDDTSTKLVNNSSINSISNVKNNNNSSNNNNSNCKGTKRGKVEDNCNLGDPINKKKKKNNISSSSSTPTSTPKTTKSKTKSTNNINNKSKSSATKSKSSTSSSFNRKSTDVDYYDRDDVSSNNTNNNNNNKSFRGPFVHVRPDGDIAVINAPNIDEDTEKLQNKLKKITGPTSSERNQIRGLHVSTLSMKYDADTRDASWICVFCKIGPHKHGLGDLFGPYILTTTCEEFQLSQLDPADDLFKSKRTKQDMIQKFIGGKRVEVTSPVSGSSNMIGKKKKKPNLDPSSSSSSSTTTNEIKLETTEINVFDGMSKAGENSYEIWTHEDCVVWAPGVHIIGSRIVGLEAAVWSSSRHKCLICLKYGAMISCLYRGCSLEVHVPCAKQHNWLLNDNDFKCYCDKHKITPTPQT